MWARMKKIDMVILTQIKTKNTTKCKKSKPLKILHQSRWWIIGIQSNELHSFWRYFYHVMIQEHMGNWIDLAPQAETVASWIIRLWTVKLILIMHAILFSNVACVTFVPLTFSRLDCLFVINGLLDLFGWCTTWADLCNLTRLVDFCQNDCKHTWLDPCLSLRQQRTAWLLWH